MTLVAHAETELRRAGLFDADADYGGATGEAVMRLVRVFAADGHSGGSAMLTLSLFEQLARFKPLTPITNDPAEWVDQSECSGRPMWQNVRRGSAFSTDGGRTYYDIDERPSRWQRALYRLRLAPRFATHTSADAFTPNTEV